MLKTSAMKSVILAVVVIALANLSVSVEASSRRLGAWAVAPATLPSSPPTPAPTSSKPTTPAPTTAKPTTSAPATLVPTTVKPITAAPATVKPTATAAPTTSKPTTPGQVTPTPQQNDSNDVDDSTGEPFVRNDDNDDIFYYDDNINYDEVFENALRNYNYSRDSDELLNTSADNDPVATSSSLRTQSSIDYFDEGRKMVKSNVDAVYQGLVYSYDIYLGEKRKLTKKGSDGTTETFTWSQHGDDASVSVTKYNCIVTYKGSTTAEQWASNLDAWKYAEFFPWDPFTWTELRKDGPLLGYVHEGFLKAYNRSRVWLLYTLADNCGEKRVLFTGHSRGGALASLAALDVSDLKDRNKEGVEPFANGRYEVFFWPKSITVVTFGEPRSCRTAAGQIDTYANRLKRSIKKLRLLNKSDIVPGYPASIPGFSSGRYPYAHWGTPLIIQMSEGGRSFIRRAYHQDAIGDTVCGYWCSHNLPSYMARLNEYRIRYNFNCLLRQKTTEMPFAVLSANQQVATPSPTPQCEPLPFPIYRLALFWFNGYCSAPGSPKSGDCATTNPALRSAFKKHLVVHGLWPTYNTLQDSKAYPEFCQTGEPYKTSEQMKFLAWDRFTSTIEASKIWPCSSGSVWNMPSDPYDKKQQNHTSWEKQWEKHGRCSRVEQGKYFKQTTYLALEIAKATNSLFWQRNGGRDIYYNQVQARVLKETIMQSLRTSVGLHNIKLVCLSRSNVLYEVSICFQAAWVGNEIHPKITPSLGLADCSNLIGPGNDKKYCDETINLIPPP